MLELKVLTAGVREAKKDVNLISAAVLRLTSDINHLELASHPTGLRAQSSIRLPPTSDASHKGVRKPPVYLTNWYITKRIPTTHLDSVTHQNDP